MREGALAICGEANAIFFVLGTKFLDLHEARTAGRRARQSEGMAVLGRRPARCAPGAPGCMPPPAPGVSKAFGGEDGRLTGCARGARPRGVTPAPFPKFAEFFRTDGTVTRPGGGSDSILVPRTKCLVLGAWKGRREGRCRAVARRAPARCRGSPVRAAPLRNTQYESISSISSRRDPGAPRLQNPHPPLRFRFAQPRSTQYFVLGTQILAALAFSMIHSSLRSEFSDTVLAALACSSAPAAPRTKYFVRSAEY